MNAAEAHIQAVQFFWGLQDRICAGLEEADGEAKFREDTWVRAEGGGGRSRVARLSCGGW